MKASWYQVDPARFSEIAVTLPNGRTRGTLLLLIFRYLSHGPLPDDDKRIALLCALPVEDVVALRPYWELLGRIEDGRIYIDFAQGLLDEQQMFIEKKAMAAKEKWRKVRDQLKAAKEGQDYDPDDDLPEESDDSDTEHSDAPLSDVVQRSASHSNGKQCGSMQCVEMPNTHTDIHSGKENTHTHTRAREDLPVPDGSVIAKFDAMEQFIIAEYGFTSVDPFLDRQIKSSVGKCNAAGFDLQAMKQFFAAREKLPGINFIAQEMQTWRAGKTRKKPDLVAVPSPQINQSPGVCTTCWGQDTVVNIVNGQPKGRIPCPKCVAKAKTA